MRAKYRSGGGIGIGAAPLFVHILSAWVLLSTFPSPSTGAMGGSPRPEIEIQTGQSSVVISVAYSPDGELLASGGMDGTVTIWRMPDGRVINRLLGDKPTEKVDLAFSPDSRYLACLRQLRGEVPTVVLNVWRVSDWKLMEELAGLEGGFLAFSPDRKFLAIGEGEKAARVWSISDGDLKETALQRHWSFRTEGKTLSPDGILEATDHDRSGPDWHIEIRRAVGHDILHRLPGKGREPDSAKFALPWYGEDKSFSPDGRFLAVGGWKDHSIRVWRVSDGRLVKTFQGTAQVLSLSFSPDGKFLITSHSAGEILLWDLSEGRFLRPYTVIDSTDDADLREDEDDQEYRKWAWQLVFSANGKYFISRSSRGTVAVQTFPGGEVKGTFPDMFSSAVSPDGQYLLSEGPPLSSSHDGGKGVYLWRISDGKLIETAIKNVHLYNAAFHPNGKLLASVEGRTIKIWRLSDGKLLQTMNEDEVCDAQVTFSPDGRLMASRCPTPMANRYMWIKLWNVKTGELVNTLKHEGGTMNPAVFSPDGTTVVYGSWGSLFFRRVSDGVIERKLTAHRPCLIGAKDGSISALAFSTQGNLLASGGADGTVKIWKKSVGAGKEDFDLLVTLVGLPDGEGVAFTPDGYYNSTPEGSSRVSWVFGGEKGREAFTFEQFETTFKRPDIVRARLKGDLDLGKEARPASRPPYVKMSDHLTFRQTSGTSYPLKLSASAWDEVKTVRIFVNGKPASEVPVNARDKDLSIDIPLLQGLNKITAIAYNQQGFSSNPRYVDVLCTRGGLAKPNLYILAIGVSRYPNLPSGMQLDYAHTDARHIVEAFKKQEGQIFEKVYQSVLTNEEVTPQKIMDNLDALKAIRETDLAVIFMAGHGDRSQKDGAFYFLTSTASKGEPERGGLGWKELEEPLSKIKGRVIMLLDACHSGGITRETVVPNDELAQQLTRGGRSGVMVFAASKGRQEAAESPDKAKGFGIFTYALCQALGPRAKEADTSGNGFLEFSELVEFVSRLVHRETDGQQTPWLARRELFGDFPVGQVERPRSRP